MVSLMKKVITAPSACGQQHGQATSSTVDVADRNGGAAASSAGLDLLIFASEVDNDSNSTADGEVPGDNDGSGDIDEAASFESNNTKNSTTATINHKAADVIACNIIKTFPQVLHEILSTPTYEAIIHWLPDGSSFIIADRHRFAEEVLPKYFRETFFHRFILKLNRWGFYRVNKDSKEKLSTSSIRFSHSCFLRDRPELCLKMKCRQTPTKVLPSVKRAQQIVAAAATNSIEKGAERESNTATAAQNMNAVTARILSSSKSLAASARSDAINPIALTCLPALPTATVSSPLTLTSEATVAAISPLTLLIAARSTSINTITPKDREFLSSIPPSHQEHLLKERQLIIAKMRQRNHLQMELKRLNDVSLQYLQSSIQIQYDYMLQRGALSTKEE